MKSVCGKCREVKEVKHILTPTYTHYLARDIVSNPIYVMVCKDCLEKHGKPLKVWRNDWSVEFEDGSTSR